MDSALALRRRGPPPVAVALGAVALLIALLASYSLSPSPGSPTSQAGIESNYGNLPLSFEPNAGRTDRHVDFLSHSLAGGTLYLTGRDAVIAFEDAAVALRFAGAAADPDARGLERQPGETNSFIGDDPAKWRSHMPTYAGVRYADVYPGIDVDFYGNQRNLEYDFRLAPQADASQIAIDVAGADSIRQNGNGDLLIAIGERTITQRAPVAYQRVEGNRRPVESAYVLEGSTATLELGPYDHSRPLVIDPTLVYSTYLGGNANDFIYAIAVDSSGAAYVSGHTLSTDFPAVGTPITGDETGGDAFVSKLNPAGTALVYSTYLGGDMAFDEAFGIAVDTNGAAYVGGSTNSTDFPTEDEFQGDQTSFDAFVTKLAPSGAALDYSTYLGGTSVDDGLAIAVDSAGAAYLTGATSSTTFPLQDQFQTDQPSSDAFITRLNPDPGGSSPVTLGYSSYLGGDSADQGSGVAVDSTGAAYLTGHTSSTNFLTQNPFQGTDPPQQDAFVTKVNADPGGAVAPTLGYSTYLGGAGNFEQGLAIAVDSANSAYVTGRTESSDFPTQGQFQSDQPGHDVFVTKLNPAGNTLAYSTYLGGSANDWGFGIAVDSANNAYVAGITGSADFPQQDSFQADAAGDDVFVTKLTPAGSTLAYSTLLGGNGTDFGRAIALDSQANAYVAGYSSSTDFPLRSRARHGERFFVNDPADSGVWAKISGEASPTTPCVILSAEKRALTTDTEVYQFHIEAHRRDEIVFRVFVKTNKPCSVTVQESPDSELSQFEFDPPTTQELDIDGFAYFFAKPRANGLLTNRVIVTTEDGDQAEASATVQVFDFSSEIDGLDDGDFATDPRFSIVGTVNSDPINGGPGIDVVDYSARVNPVTVNLVPRQRAKKRCHWLTKKGTIKEVKPNNGVCDEPIWIRAKLKGKAKDRKRRWEDVIKKRLPPGKYTFYSRATNKAGVSEPEFSKKIGNLKKIKVKR